MLPMYWSLKWTFTPDRQFLPRRFKLWTFHNKHYVVPCRRKSSSGMSEAENERTSNIYGDGAENSQHFGNGVPLEDMPNEPADRGSAAEHPTPPYTHLGNAPAQPVYSVVRKDRLGRQRWQSVNQSKYLLTVVFQSHAGAPAYNLTLI